MFFPRVLFILALISSAVNASPARNKYNLRSGCDDSYPLASSKNHGQHNNQHLVSIPNDERSYAPLCSDGRHIDIRKLQSCPIGQCWATVSQSCMYDESATCQSQQQTNNAHNEVAMDTRRNGGDHDREEEETRKCPGGQCWSELYYSCFHVMSQECLSPPTGKPTIRTTMTPTQKPTFKIEKTEHNVELTLENVTPGYKLTMESRALIIRFAVVVIESYLEEPLELVEVTFGGYLARRRLSRWRRLEDLSVPLKVTVQGPTNVRDFALSYIMDILQERLSGLVSELKNQDYDAFKDVTLSSSTYSESDIMEETDQPTGRPSPAPSPPPFIGMEETVHPVKLLFRNMPQGFSMSEEMRAAMIRFIERLMDDDLDARLELIDVRYAGILIEDKYNVDQRISGQQHQPERRLVTQSLPLLFTLWGPADVSALAPVLIMEVLDNNIDEIAELLGSLDGELFIDGGSISVDTYDVADIVYATRDPTGGPTMRNPTGRPTMMETRKPTYRVVSAVHPVKLVFDSAPPGYKFSSADRSSLILFLKELLNNNLDPDVLKVTKITYAGRRRLQGGTRFLQSAPELPLLIEAEGPEDVSDFALPLIMEVIEDNMDELHGFLKEIDGLVFEDPEVTVTTFDPDAMPAPPNTPIRPVNPREDEGATVPWWAWFLLGIGLVALSCFLCFCCRSLCRYQTHNDEYKDYSKEEKVVERQIVEKPVYIETPVFVEKPIIVEKQVRDRRPKKQKKKKKRKTRVTKMLHIIDRERVLQIEHEKVLQIEHEEKHYDGPVIAVHNRAHDMTARSLLTLDNDPPSENHAQMEGWDSYHGRLLDPSVAETSLPQICMEPSAAYTSVGNSGRGDQMERWGSYHGRLLAPSVAETPLPQICMEPSAAYTSVGNSGRGDEPSASFSVGYSIPDPYRSERLEIENQSYYSQHSRGQAHYIKDEPSGNVWNDASDAGQSYHGCNEPSGHEYAVSGQQEQPSCYSRASTRTSKQDAQSHSTEHSQIGHELARMTSHDGSQHQDQPSYASRASTRVSKEEAQSYATEHSQRGHDWAGVNISQHQEQPSHASRASSSASTRASKQESQSHETQNQEPPSTGFSRRTASSIFASLRESTLRESRRQSGGIKSDADSSTFAFSQQTSQQANPM